MCLSNSETKFWKQNFDAWDETQTYNSLHQRKSG